MRMNEELSAEIRCETGIEAEIVAEETMTADMAVDLSAAGNISAVDDRLSMLSVNPVQNRVVAAALAGKADRSEIPEAYDDSEIREELDSKADKSDIPEPYDDTEIRAELAGKADITEVPNIKVNNAVNADTVGGYSVADISRSEVGNTVAILDRKNKKILDAHTDTLKVGHANTADGLTREKSAIPYYPIDFVQKLADVWTSGDIKELVLKSVTGCVFINPGVADMPADNSYWFAFIEATHVHRKITATTVGGADTFIRTFNNGTQSWSAWRKTSDGGNADMVDGKHASDFSPAIKNVTATISIGDNAAGNTGISKTSCILAVRDTTNNGYVFQPFTTKAGSNWFVRAMPYGSTTLVKSVSVTVDISYIE